MQIKLGIETETRLSRVAIRERRSLQQQAEWVIEDWLRMHEAGGQVRELGDGYQTATVRRALGGIDVGR